MAADGYPRSLGSADLLAEILRQLDGRNEGLVSINRAAQRLGVVRRHAQLAFDMLVRMGAIEVLESKRGVGTRVRYKDADGGGEVYVHRSGYPRDLRDSDPDGSLSGPVRTYKLHEIQGNTAREVTAPAPELDDWEEITPVHGGVRDDMTARLTSSRGVILSAGASRSLLGDRSGTIRLTVERSRARRQIRVRPDPRGHYQTTYRPPAQGNARVGGGRLISLLVELGAAPGRSYEVRIEDGWAVIDLTRPVKEVQAS